MPRLIQHTATGPIRIDPQERPVWICACGLSRNQPFCDGSHKGCAGEDPNVTYEYQPDGTRREVTT